MKNVDKTLLPVHWRANKKTWMTESLFKDWFFNCFISEVEAYLKDINLDFKLLLLLDNAPGHPKDLQQPNVKVIFLPPNTTSLIQPINQGIIATFKAFYIRRTFQAILDKLDVDPALTLTMVWKSFTIFDCVNIVAAAKEKVRKSTLNVSWRNIWSSVVLEKKSSFTNNRRLIPMHH
jgi:hypothetical protein